jgi:hypothetical protein
MKVSLDSLGVLWRNAWRLYTDRFAVVTTIVLAPSVLLGLGDIFKYVGGLPISIAGSILLACGVLLSIVAGAATIHSLHHSTGFDESYRAGGRLLWPLILIALLMGFAVLGGFVMLIIPGVWLAIMLIFSNYVLVIEGKHGFAALTESREYVKGYWWAIFGRIILLIIVFLVAYVIVSIPFGLVGGMIGRALASTIVTLFIVPFSVAYYYTIYRNLVALKPHVQNEHASGKKTFIIIAQVVGAVFVILVLMGAGFTALFGQRNNQASSDNYGNYGAGSPPPPPALPPSP